MTKPKTSPFKGGWLDGTFDERLVLRLIANSPGSVAPERVLEVLSRQLSIYRFNRDRLQADPEPGQIAELVGRIEVPDRPSITQMLKLERAIARLPARAVAGLSYYAAQSVGVSIWTLLERMREGGAPITDGETLREALRQVAGDLALVRGKTGPKPKRGGDVSRALTAVTRAIEESSTLGKPAARALAADLLRNCGMPVPESVRQLQDLSRP